MPIDLVIKLGGAAITNKSEYETLNAVALETTVAYINEVINKGFKIIIVHGAGSYGHHTASKYNLKRGGRDKCANQQQLMAALADVHRSVTKLNHIVVSKLIERGVPAVGVSPFTLGWTCNKGNLNNFANCAAALEPLIAQGLVPVLHGDVVFDDEYGTTILSGDQIMYMLCDRYKPKVAVFMTNTRGIYTQPPENNPDAKPIREIFRGLTEQDEYRSYGAAGGMTGKLQTAIDIVDKTSTHVRIVKADEIDAFVACSTESLPYTWQGTEIYTGIRKYCST